MTDIYDFLNKKDALRQLSDEEFENILPELAKQLSQVDYHFFYTEKELREDWKKLCFYFNNNFSTAAQTRPEIKLCEHFFSNFFDILSPKGEGFKTHWNEQDLQKVIRWNRKSHSAPYLSEMRRGVSFCYGLTKNTMYRPHLAKMICDYYRPLWVLDPCCGWGGRMLGVVASGAKYYGFEPNKETYNHLMEPVDFLDIKNDVIIYNEPVEKANHSQIGCVNMVLTSPPYYNLEVYSQEETQCENRFSSYEEWKNEWLFPLIKNCGDVCSGPMCWNVANVGKMRLQDDLIQYCNEIGWGEDKVFGIGSSARQTNQNELKNKKNFDATICLRKM